MISDRDTAKCIDQYIKLRVEQVEEKEGNKIEIDKRLENIVLGMFDRCFQHKKYRQALGIALESRRLDKLEQAITSADDVPEMLRYALQVSLDLVLHRDFRQNVSVCPALLVLTLFFLGPPLACKIVPTTSCS